MVSNRIQRLLHEELDKLPEGLQERVVEYARSLALLPKGSSGDELARLKGVLPLQDAREVGEIIERDCERVDPDAW